MVGTKASHCKSQVLQKRKFWFCVLVLVLKGPEDNRQQGKKNDVCRTSAPLEEMEGVPDGERWGEGVGVASALTKTVQAWKNTRA